MDTRLSQDAEYLLCTLYDAYRTRRKSGELAEDAKFFGSSEQIQASYVQEWPTNDIDEAARELHRKGMIIASFADNALDQCCLSSDGIVYVENQFGDKLDRLAQRIATLRAIIFG